jgi:hypothetical protein
MAASAKALRRSIQGADRRSFVAAQRRSSTWRRSCRSAKAAKARWQSPSRFCLLFAHDLRANAFAFVARENHYTLFRIMR